MRVTRLEPRFMDQRPDELEEGVLYVFVGFRTSVHLCCCGCKNEVWLPIRPNRWEFTYDGEAISLSPSVGNWSFPCQSHYWIRNGRVDWARAWSAAQIDANRQRTRERDVEYVADVGATWWRRVVRAVRRRLQP